MRAIGDGWMVGLGVFSNLGYSMILYMPYIAGTVKASFHTYSLLEI